MTQNWDGVVEIIKERFGNETDLKAILFVIGMREYGKKEKKFSKEQKTDLMNLAVCKILSLEGYFIIKDYDLEGWPIWQQMKPLPTMDNKQQEEFIREKVVNYFKFEKLFAAA
ncbi:MAG: hypothetical protein NTX03_06270 [Bacteroidetes bacterium]|nr:hypothetical protein [Bacteroidota bacterium]